MKCFARFKVLPNGNCVREYGEHSNHANHETNYADMIRRNQMNDDIDTMVAIAPESVHAINTRNIFNRRKAELVVFLIEILFYDYVRNIYSFIMILGEILSPN